MKLSLSQTAVLILFLSFMLFGLKAWDDYGISWDEPIERESSLVTWKYLHPEDSTLITDTVNFNMIADLHSYFCRYYGTAAQLPLVFLESRTGFTMPLRDVYLMRHLYVFLLFFCASVCYYRMCRYFTENIWLSLTGTLFLILSPRILADSFYNIKDSLTLSLYLAASWTGICFLKKPDVRNILLFSFFSALCTNARIVGAIVPVCCFAVALLKSAVTRIWKKQLAVLSVTGILTVGFYILLSPVTWRDPLGEMINTVKTFSSYRSYEGTVLFLKQYYPPDGLPWFYLPLWILITTPLTILALAFAGIAFRLTAAISAAVKQKISVAFSSFLSDTKNSRGAAGLFLFLAAAVPFFYALLFKPSLYNGWRHFYFLYPFIALSATDGLRFLFHKMKPVSFPFLPERLQISGQPALLAAVFFCLCFTGVWILSRHPYEYAYFNWLARGRVENNFEKDYWAVSQKDQLAYLCATEPEKELSVWVNDGTQSCRYLLNDADQNRILITDNAARAGWLINRHVEDPSSSWFQLEHMYRPLHSITVDGVALNTLYQRVYEQSVQSFLTQTETHGTYTAGAIDWDYASDGNTVTWTGRLSQPLPTDLLMVTPAAGSSLIPMDSLRAEVSGDGLHWTETRTVSGRDFHFPRMDLGWIRITYPDPGNGRLEVCIYQKIEEGQTEILSLIEGVFASSNGDQAVLAVDGTELTRWSSSETQKPGMEYRLSLRRTCPLSQITLSLGDSPWDRPAELEIWNSEDGKNWSKLDAATEDGENYFFERTDCRNLKFVLGKSCEGSQANWSIYEISLYGEAG